MARYRTKPQVVDAVQAMNGLWMIRALDAKNNVELIDVMTHKAFFEKYEPLEEGAVDACLLCARCRAPKCPSSCTGQHYVGPAAWEPPETPAAEEGTS